jgi:hypothetical protein
VCPEPEMALNAYSGRQSMGLKSRFNWSILTNLIKSSLWWENGEISKIKWAYLLSINLIYLPIIGSPGHCIRCYTVNSKLKDAQVFITRPSHIITVKVTKKSNLDTLIHVTDASHNPPLFVPMKEIVSHQAPKVMCAI